MLCDEYYNHSMKHQLIYNSREKSKYILYNRQCSCQIGYGRSTAICMAHHKSVIEPRGKIQL